MSKPSDRPPIIDVQVHAYERDHPGRPWVDVLPGPPQVTGEDMVNAMDSVGVDGALLVSPWTMYRYDASYAIEVKKRHPDRFALIKPFDYRDSDVEQQLVEWAAIEGAVGARIVLLESTAPSADDAGLRAIVRTATRLDLPLNILCWGRHELFESLAANHPDTSLLLDHLGIFQPFEPPPPEAPFADLDAVLALARFPNVAIKISGACTLSREPYPFEDIWDPLCRIFDAFGMERCLWGTDWTRATAFLTYAQGVDAFLASPRLSNSDRAALMGGNTQRIYRWAPRST